MELLARGVLTRACAQLGAVVVAVTVLSILGAIVTLPAALMLVRLGGKYPPVAVHWLPAAGPCLETSQCLFSHVWGHAECLTVCRICAGRLVTCMRCKMLRSLRYLR